MGILAVHDPPANRIAWPAMTMTMTSEAIEHIAALLCYIEALLAPVE